MGFFFVKMWSSNRSSFPHLPIMHQKLHPEPVSRRCWLFKKSWWVELSNSCRSEVRGSRPTCTTISRTSSNYLNICSRRKYWIVFWTGKVGATVLVDICSNWAAVPSSWTECYLRQTRHAIAHRWCAFHGVPCFLSNQLISCYCQVVLLLKHIQHIKSDLIPYVLR